MSGQRGDSARADCGARQLANSASSGGIGTGGKPRRDDLFS